MKLKGRHVIIFATAVASTLFIVIVALTLRMILASRNATAGLIVLKVSHIYSTNIAN
jgi:hypothetical protein